MLVEHTPVLVEHILEQVEHNLMDNPLAAAKHIPEDRLKLERTNQLGKLGLMGRLTAIEGHLHIKGKQ
jgi:hypothetical protein